jgi:cupin fold WbuC family metalloprotein
MFSEITCKRDFNAKSLSFNVVDDYVVLSKVTMAEISKLLKDNNMVRLCVHSGKSELTQFMVIGITSKTYIRPHKNTSKDKIYCVVKGVIEFDIYKTGKIILKEKEILKIKKNTYASIVSISDESIYHEIVSGPFVDSDTEYV